MKRILVLLVSAAMLLCLVGCDTGSPPIAESFPESVAMNGSGQEEYSPVESEPIVESENESTQGDTVKENSELEPEAPVEVDTSGIVMMLRDMGGDVEKAAIVRLNPETGEYTQLQSFSFQASGASDELYSLGFFTYYDNGSDKVSRDFSKIAVTSLEGGPWGNYRAGWMDSQGNFFDVAKATGLDPDNEFEKQPNFYAIGFYCDDVGNEFFVFAASTTSKTVHSNTIIGEGTFYYVALDNSTVAYEGNPLGDDALQGHSHTRVTRLTAWLDNERYLANYGENWAVMSATDRNAGADQPIPGEMRFNYDPILGPNGEVAFASYAKQGGSDLAIYVTDVEGNSPQRIFDCGIFSEPGVIFSNAPKHLLLNLLWWE